MESKTTGAPDSIAASNLGRNDLGKAATSMEPPPSSKYFWTEFQVVPCHTGKAIFMRRAGMRSFFSAQTINSSTVFSLDMSSCPAVHFFQLTSLLTPLPPLRLAQS